MLLTIRWASVAGWCFTLALATGHAEGDDQLKQRFLSEAPAKWADLERLSEHVEGVYTEKVSSTVPGKPPEFVRSKFTVNGKNVKAEIELGEKATNVRVESSNPKYFFKLARPQFSPEYAIEFLERADSSPDPEFRKDANHAVREHVSRIFCSWYLLGRPISDWVKDPAFKIENVESVENEGHDLVRVVFEYSPKDKPEVQRLLSGSALVFDPGGYWSIREIKVKRNWGTVATKLSYGDTADGFPYVKASDEVLDDGKNQLSTTLTFEKFERKEVPESAFTLTAYNLPEPDFNGGYRSTTFYWYLAFAVILGFVTTLLMRKRTNKEVSSG